MKKLFVAVLTILTCGSAFALPVGNPSEASLLTTGICWDGFCGDACDPSLTICDAFSFRFGFYGDYVFNRHLEVDLSDNSRDVKHSHFSTNAAYFAGNMWNRFDVFFTLGSTSYELQGNDLIFATVGSGSALEQFTIYADNDFSWSVGGRATAWECGALAVGIEAQYFQARNHITEALQDNNEFNPPSSVSSKWYEWQVGLGLSYKVCCNVVPYAAVKWSGGKLNLGNAVGILNSDALTTTLYSLKTQKTWGYAVGVTLVGCERSSITAEARFADELGLYINGQIRF